MASIREQILARVKTALTGTTPAGTNVARDRVSPIDRSMTPFIDIVPRDGTGERFGDQTDKRVLRLEIGIFVRADPWTTAADAVDVAAHAILMTDAPLRALALDIRRTGAESFDASETDITAGTLTAGYDITYLTRADDLTGQPT